MGRGVIEPKQQMAGNSSHQLNGTLTRRLELSTRSSSVLLSSRFTSLYRLFLSSFDGLPCSCYGKHRAFRALAFISLPPHGCDKIDYPLFPVS
jgi:hypothetical protein